MLCLSDIAIAAVMANQIARIGTFWVSLFISVSLNTREDYKQQFRYAIRSCPSSCQGEGLPSELSMHRPARTT